MEKESKQAWIFFLIIYVLLVVITITTVYFISQTNPSFSTISDIFIPFIFYLLLFFFVLLFIIFYFAIHSVKKEEMNSKKETDAFFDNITS